MNKNKFTGVLLVILSTVAFASLYPLTKKANEKIPPFTVIAIAEFVLFFIAFILSIIFEDSLHLKVSLNKTSILLIMLAGAINVLAYWLQILGYKYMPVWQQTMITLLIPIFAAIFSFFILGERLSPNLLIGIIIIGLGLYVCL